jgi:RNA polymerase sigma-B factor
MTTTAIRHSISANPREEGSLAFDRPLRCELRRGNRLKELAQEEAECLAETTAKPVDRPRGDPTTELALFARYRETESASDLDNIVRNYQGLVKSLAFRFRGRGAELDDLMQVAEVGLLLSIDRFDVDRGVPFVGFATTTILGELRKSFRAIWSVHMPRSLQESTQLLGPATNELQQELRRPPSLAELADRTGIPCAQIRQVAAAAGAFRSRSLDSPLFTRSGKSLSLYESIPSVDAGNAFEAVDEKQAVERLLEKLSSRSRQIVELRFYQEQSQSEIAEAVGLSQMQVSRLLRQAMRLMSSTSPQNTTAKDTTQMAA